MISLLMAIAVMPVFVSANPFSPSGPCSGNFFGMPFPPGCCYDDCFLGQWKCSDNAKYQIPCGDFDSWIPFDFDQCYEWAPSPDYGWIECENGKCVGDEKTGICREYVSESSCADQCAGGSIRCGNGDGAAGVKGMYICEEETSPYHLYYGCYVWHFLRNCGATSGGQIGETGECIEGQCQTISMIECSGDCTGPEQHKCVGDSLVPCKKIDPINNCWDWSENPNDYYPCSSGCYGPDGSANCMTQSGDPQPYCNPTNTQCNPDYTDYMQLCDTETEGGYTWNSDLFDPECRQYDPSTGQFSCFCQYGCEPSIGKCRSRPLPDDFNMSDEFSDGQACIKDDSRCSGDEYYSTCEYNPILGLYTWGPVTRCWDGFCFNGGCTIEVPGGYLVTPDDVIGRAPSGLISNGRSFFVSGVIKNQTFDRSNPGYWGYDYALFQFDLNGTYLRSYNITDDDYSYKLNDMAWTGQKIIATSFTGCGYNNVHDCMKVITIDGDNQNEFSIVNLTWQPNMYTGGIAYGNEKTWLTSRIYGIMEMGDTSNSFCTYIADTDFQAKNLSVCARLYTTLFGLPMSMLQFDQAAQRFYLMETQLVSNDGDVPGIPDWLNTMKVFGLDGQYFGGFNTSYYEWFGDMNWQTGFTKYNDFIYYLYPGRGEWSGSDTLAKQNTANMFWETSRMSYKTGTNDCFEGASHCEWNYIVDCVKILDNKGASTYKWWKPYYYVDPEWANNFPGPYQVECNGTQKCTEEWVNHKLTEASCIDWACPDPPICVKGESMCDPTGRFQINCTFRDISWNALTGSVNCWTWAKSYNYMPCAPGMCYSDVCQPPIDQCIENETRCRTSSTGSTDFITNIVKSGESYIGRSYIEYCRRDQYGYTYWDSGNRTSCPWGCDTSFDETTNMGSGSCKKMDTLPVGIKNSVNEYAVWMRLLFPDPASKIGFALIFIAAIAILFLYFGMGSKTTMIMVSFVALIFIFMNWIPIALIAVPIVFVAFTLYKKFFGNGGDEQ